MAGGFPTEEIARQVAADLRGVDVLGRYVDDQDVIVVRLPRLSSAHGLPEVAAGYRVRYEASQLTVSEKDAAIQAVIAVDRRGARFAMSYDVHLDQVRVAGYFPDQAVATAISQIPGVVLISLPPEKVMSRHRPRRRG